MWLIPESSLVLGSGHDARRGMGEARERIGETVVQMADCEGSRNLAKIFTSLFSKLIVCDVESLKYCQRH